MVKKKESEEDKQAYLSIGTVFLIASVGFFLSESARSISIVFAILGVTFIILGVDKKNKKDN